jgi:hypothetical protein
VGLRFSLAIAFGYQVKNVVNLFGHQSTLQHFIDFWAQKTLTPRLGSAACFPAVYINSKIFEIDETSSAESASIANKKENVIMLHWGDKSYYLH